MRGFFASFDALLLGALALVGLGLGAVGTVNTAVTIFEGIRAQYWPTTTGRIVALDNETKEGTEGCTTKTTARYSYTVNGQAYEGTRIHPTYRTIDCDYFVTPLRALKDKASRVTVYYNPSDPAQSTLTAGGFLSSFLSLGFSISLGLVGVGFALLSIGKREQDIIAAINVTD